MARTRPGGGRLWPLGGAAQAASIDDPPIVDPMRICFPEGAFLLQQGERVIELLSAFEGTAFTVEAPGALPDIRERQPRHAGSGHLGVRRPCGIAAALAAP